MTSVIFLGFTAERSKERRENLTFRNKMRNISIGKSFNEYKKVCERND